MKIPELLAPAGDKDSFYAALNCGADAVYLGGKSFSARAGAGNFSDEELKSVIADAHFCGVKVYCAVNTLIADSELPACLDYIKFLADIGIDAVIVQDYGLFTAIRRLFPQLSVNASTQMTVHNSEGARLLSGQGANRIILSRELSVADIAEIKTAIPSELEVFVHGALCVCYSGQCLMSSMIGGRSGNRGRCAQPCRLPYWLTDAQGKPLEQGIGEYLLSPKDLFGITAINELLATGVDSLKIEGRMKRPEYVAVVTDNYHRLLQAFRDNSDFDREQALAELKQIFNRDFGAGYLLGNAGGELCSGKKPNNRGVFLGRVLSCGRNKLRLKTELSLRAGDGLEIWVTKGGRSGFYAEDMRVAGICCDFAEAGSEVELNFEGKAFAGDRIFKTNDSELMSAAAASIRRERTMPLKLHLCAKKGGFASLLAEDERGAEHTAVDESYTVCEAKNRPADYEYIKGQLERLGGSGYRLAGLSCDIDEGIMLPASVLNKLRRDCVEVLRRHYEQERRYPLPSGSEYTRQRAAILSKKPAKRKPQPKLAVLCADMRSAIAVSAVADIAYLEDGLFEKGAEQVDYRAAFERIRANGAEPIPVLPQIFLNGEAAYWRHKLALWQEAGARSYRIESLGALQLVKDCGIKDRLCGGLGLNVFNSLTAERLFEQGLSRLLLSSELSMPQIRELHFSGEKELLMHGAAQLMISQYCVLGGVLGGRTAQNPCSMPCKDCNSHMLRDKLNFGFPLRCDRFCRMHIFNSRELCMLGELRELAGCGMDIALLDLRLHEAGRAEQITSLYRRALTADDTKPLLEEAFKLTSQGFTKGHFYRGVCDGQ